MKKKLIYIGMLWVLAVAAVLPANNRSEKKADEDTETWRYEIEVVNTGVQGTYQVKVWSYSRKPETILLQAQKNAVHGIIFKGFGSSPDGRIQGKQALAPVNSELEHAAYYTEFFKDGGTYLKFVNLINNGAILPGDRMKIGKEYKIGVVVSVNVAALRKELETSNIIRALNSGF